MTLLHKQFVDLVRCQLGMRKNIAKALVYLECTPEVIDILVGELQAAINLFGRYRVSDMLRDQKLFPNAEFLIRVLGDECLPAWQEIREKLISNQIGNQSREFDVIFEEIGSFEFADKHDLSPLEILGTLFVSLYRTYALVTRPHLRSADAMVGSTIAEMLALLAFRGCKTHLFCAEKVWILSYEDEGFAEELAQKVEFME